MPISATTAETIPIRAHRHVYQAPYPSSSACFYKEIAVIPKHTGYQALQSPLPQLLLSEFIFVIFKSFQFPREQCPKTLSGDHRTYYHCVCSLLMCKTSFSRRKKLEIIHVNLPFTPYCSGVSSFLSTACVVSTVGAIPFKFHYVLILLYTSPLLEHLR